MTISDFLNKQSEVNKEDLINMIKLIPVFIIYRLIISNLILKPLSKFVKPQHRYKFVHRGFDCIDYIISTILGMLSFRNKSYGHCSYYYFDCREHIDNQPNITFISNFEKIYYYYFGLYYLSDVFWISTTKDVLMLIVHHCLTIGWVVSFALLPLPPVCLTGGLLHDYVDVFLYSGKIASYFNIKIVSDTLLILFAISFFYLRILNCGSIYYIGSISNTPQRHTLYFRTLFTFLYCCHLIWGYQIVNAVRKILLGDKIHDTRSDREDDREKNKKKN